MTSIEFYFDPVCPFSWIASRWLLQVQAKRDIKISWQQFSLALKNDHLDPQTSTDPHAKSHFASHRVHRIIHQANLQYAISTIDLYSEFGTRYHLMEKAFDDDIILEVFDTLKLPKELLKSADDDSIDQALQAELDSAIAAAGQDIGVPTIVFTDKDDGQLGYFGPVLNELPNSIEESLAIWDGLEKLATVSSFYELKRARPSGNPNVFSAARC